MCWMDVLVLTFIKVHIFFLQYVMDVPTLEGEFTDITL